MKIWYEGILPCAGDYQTGLVLAEEVIAADPENYLAFALMQVAAFYCKEYNKMINAERFLLRMFNVKEEDIQEMEKIFEEQGIIKAYEKIMNLPIPKAD